jgi:HEAT repeat protein
MQYNKPYLIITLAIVFISSVATVVSAQTQTRIEGIDARTNTAELAKQLSNADPNVRQRSAEALARLAAADQTKLVEGYYLEEKNKEVRLAMDWALYRFGKSQSLFRIVHDLDSGRQEQAIGYLSQLESPDVLYPFLKKSNNASRVNVGLLKALTLIGNAQTIEVIKPYLESVQPYVAEAAENATDEINKRLGEAESGTSRSRPRVAKP